VTASPKSYTGRYLKPILERDRKRTEAQQGVEIAAAKAK